MNRPAIRLGLERCLEQPPAVLREGRLGVLVNQASVDRHYRQAHLLLARRFPGQVRALFSPQHGLWSEQQDNMIETGHSFDPELGVPVYSLYSDTRRPTREMLADLDALVVDLPDVGCRVYTYAWTLTLCLEACAEAGVAVVVLDRPDPLGGTVAEGHCLEPGFESFVGRGPLPMRHGLTLGELARWYQEREDLPVDLQVVPWSGGGRALMHPDTGRAWVPPSPNLPRFEGALVYPGMVLLEGTNLSEGRGTTTPFECFGAPWLDPARVLEDLERDGAPAGLVLRPIRFEPTFGKWQGRSCGGLFLHVTDRDAFAPVRTAVRLLQVVRQRWPDRFAWTAPPYEYETRRAPIDCITGGDRVRRYVEGDGDPALLDALCDPGQDWKQRLAGLTTTAGVEERQGGKQP